MNRRRFFLAAAAAPIAYSFLGGVYAPSRGIIQASNITLAEWAKTLHPTGMIIAPFGSYPGLTVAEFVKRQNEILEEVIWSEPGSLASPTAYHRNPFMIDHL